MFRRAWAFNGKLRELWSPTKGATQYQTRSPSRIGLLYHSGGDRYWQEVWALATDIQKVVDSVQRTNLSVNTDRYPWGATFDPRVRTLARQLALIVGSAATLLDDQEDDMDHGAAISNVWEENFQSFANLLDLALSQIQQLISTWSFARDFALSTLAINESTIAEAFRLNGGLEELFDVAGRGLIKDAFKAHETATGEEYWWQEVALISSAAVRVVRNNTTEQARKAELGKLVDNTRAFLR